MVAEALAVKEGMAIAAANGVSRMVVETDSQLVVAALKNPRQDFSYFGGIIGDILALCSVFEFCSFCWVRRSGNVVAHGLASFGFSCDVPFFSPILPDEIVTFVETDLSGSF